MRKMLMILAAVLTATCVAIGPTQAQATLTDGVVTKVDPSAGKITIRHGPMPKFDMEDPMTMVYRAQDPSILKAVKAGDKVKFDAERMNGQFTVTEIQKVK
jgi:Cu/Ag efflux protein CusF